MRSITSGFTSHIETSGELRANPAGASVNRSRNHATTGEQMLTSPRPRTAMRTVMRIITDMPMSPIHVARAACLVAIVALSGAVAAAQTQSGATRSVLAYTASYCECSGGCPAFCASPNASLIVTPFWHSTGPSDASPSWSPDGTLIAFTSDREIVVADVTSGARVNVTNTASGEYEPSWSPDGYRIAFVSDRGAETALYVMNTNGSGVVRLIGDGLVRSSSRSTWSPDSTVIGFDCQVEIGNDDICAIASDGSNFRRLTYDAAPDVNPTWSPDGQRIAFATGRFAADQLQLAAMNADGSDVSRLGDGISGWRPAWSTDGTQIAFEGPSLGGYSPPDVYTINADGSGMTFIVEYAGSPSWTSGSGLLVPSFTTSCNGLTCSFDASGSVGTIANYTWDFGDGGSASGITPIHTYAVGGSKTVALTTTDESGRSRTMSVIVRLNLPPVAKFTAACDGLTCLFDWTGTSDPDGTGLSIWFDWGSPGVYNWVTVSASSARLTYPAPGTYTAGIRVGDDSGAMATASQTFTLGTPDMHVGDLDLTNTGQNTWQATIAIHDAGHQPVSQATVTISTGGGTASCRTDLPGRCVVSNIRLGQKGSVTVKNVTQTRFAYKPTSNHDPDGDSNGTVIVASRQ